MPLGVEQAQVGSNAFRLWFDRLRMLGRDFTAVKIRLERTNFNLTRLRPILRPTAAAEIRPLIGMLEMRIEELKTFLQHILEDICHVYILIGMKVFMIFAEYELQMEFGMVV